MKVDPAALSGWILYEDEHLLVINKPGWLVCHPGKDGPWSSLVGACREYCQLERLHLVNRLDRETTGIVVIAKDVVWGSLLQKAVQHRQVSKTYLALVCGALKEEVVVNQPIGRAEGSPVWVQQAVSDAADARSAETVFRPLWSDGEHSLVVVYPHTGRLHQIRVHAAWLGMPILGDKIYGPDPRHYLTFINTGMTPALEQVLGFPRQALHAWRWQAELPDGTTLAFEAPMQEDMTEWLASRGAGEVFGLV